jgi:hypothetical protein
MFLWLSLKSVKIQLGCLRLQSTLNMHSEVLSTSDCSLPFRCKERHLQSLFLRPTFKFLQLQYSHFERSCLTYIIFSEWLYLVLWCIIHSFQTIIMEFALMQDVSLLLYSNKKWKSLPFLHWTYFLLNEQTCSKWLDISHYCYSCKFNKYL